MIRVGVDAWNLPGDRRGIGRYLRSVLRVWREQFTDRVEISLIVPEWHTWTVSGRYRREVQGARYRVVSRALHQRAPLDVLWFPWNGCSWTSFSKPAVVTLHDASNFVVPGYSAQTQTIFHAAARRARSLITDSVFSQRELARELDIEPERLIPIPLGVDPVTEVPPLPSHLAAYVPYVLFVGESERRKGVDVLVEAFSSVRRERPELHLLLAGPRGDARRADAPPGVIDLGFVDDRLLSALYGHAALFAFPSRYEGFGLPVLEAMAHGTPVVTTRASALPETAGDAAAYVALDDADGLAGTMLQILRQPEYAQRLRIAGRERAATLSWTRTAEATLSVLEASAR